MAVMGLACAVQAGDLKIDAKLVWGTNADKSPDSAHKPVSADLAKKLVKIFKWKNYFEVKAVQESVPNRSTKRIHMSKKCELEVTEMEGPKVEVKLYGEGKLVTKTVKSLYKGDFLTLGGEDKGDNSWFIVITLLEDK